MLQLDKAFFDLLEHARIVHSRMLREKNEKGKLDIAIVEGSIISKKEIEQLQAIRKRSKFLVALGSCACLGGIPAIRNTLSAEQKNSIEKFLKKIKSKKVLGVGEVVKVDYFLHGCPIVHEEVEKVLKLLLSGQTPKQVDYPVCFECKANENPCLLLENISCFGPVATAGCNAMCTTQGFHCTACRGIMKDANLKALRGNMLKRGIPEKEINDLLNLYNADRWHKT